MVPLNSRTAFGVGLFLAVLVFTFGPSGCNRARSNDVTLGTVLPLSGNYAEYGANVLAALQIAVEELPNSRIRLLAEDDGADPTKAVSAVQKLIQLNGAKFIIGGFTSASSIAMYPVAARSGVLMFSPSSSTPSLTANTPLFFRNWPTDTKQAKEFARQTISRFGKRSAEILYSNSEYGVNAKKLFRDAYEALAGKVPVEESYEPNATDFRPQIRKFQQTPAECVWLFGYYSEVGRFLKQARELGLRTQFFGQEGIEGNDLLTVAGPASEGLIYFVPSFDPESPSDQVKKFSAAFRARTGHEPDVFAAHAYDALRILVGAIHTVGADPQKVARYLPSVKNYQGVAGLTSIDENGDAIKPLMVKTVANGRFVRFH